MALKKTDQVYIDNYSKNKSPARSSTSATTKTTNPVASGASAIYGSNQKSKSQNIIDDYNNREKSAIDYGSKIGMSEQDAQHAFRMNTGSLDYMKSAADSLGGVSEQQYQDSSARDTYLANLKSQLEAQNAAYDQLMAYNQQMYAEQQRQAALQREENARRAYVAKEMALKNMPGQLAREGINGGLAETSRVRLNNRYNRSLSDGDLAYSDAVNKAYLDMVNSNREPVAGKAAAQANYNSGVANAPSVKTKTVKTETGDAGAFYTSMKQLGYTDDEIAIIWNGKHPD